MVSPYGGLDHSASDGFNYDVVIVDEAHHYPAPTWKLLVDHLGNSKRLFLTATHLYQGRPILPDNGPLCFQLPKHVAISRGIIRPLRFEEPGNLGDETPMRVRWYDYVHNICIIHIYM